MQRVSAKENFCWLCFWNNPSVNRTQKFLPVLLQVAYYIPLWYNTHVSMVLKWEQRANEVHTMESVGYKIIYHVWLKDKNVSFFSERKMSWLTGIVLNSMDSFHSIKAVFFVCKNYHNKSCVGWCEKISIISDKKFLKQPFRKLWKNIFIWTTMTNFIKINLILSFHIFYQEFVCKQYQKTKSTTPYDSRVYLLSYGFFMK